MVIRISDYWLGDSLSGILKILLLHHDENEVFLYAKRNFHEKFA